MPAVELIDGIANFNLQVNRHVRILDQAIKEQEASISFGARPSHLAPSNLPELAVPRWARPARATMSPVDDDDDAELLLAVGDGGKDVSKPGTHPICLLITE